MRNDKLLTTIIFILAAILILETGYIIGSNKAEKKSKAVEQAPGKAAQSKGLVSPGMGMMAGTQPLVRSDMDVFDPYAEMQRMQRAMNRMFNETYYNAMLHGESGFVNDIMEGAPGADSEQDEFEMEKEDNIN